MSLPQEGFPEPLRHVRRRTRRQQRGEAVETLKHRSDHLPRPELFRLEGQNTQKTPTGGKRFSDVCRGVSEVLRNPPKIGESWFVVPKPMRDIDLRYETGGGGVNLGDHGWSRG